MGPKFKIYDTKIQIYGPGPLLLSPERDFMSNGSIQSPWSYLEPKSAESDDI